MVNPAYVWAGSNLDLNFATLFTWVKQANLYVSMYVKVNTLVCIYN